MIAILSGMLRLHLTELDPFHERFKIADADQMRLHCFWAVFSSKSLPIVDHPIVGGEPVDSPRPHFLPNTSWRGHFAFECDGAAYHSSRSSRDRDRLRQEVLEGLGWHFYRIWSTDWFRNPRDQIEKLRKALDRSLAPAKSDEQRRKEERAEAALRARHAAENITSDIELFVSQRSLFPE